MQDAVPIRLGQEFGAYRAVVERDLGRMTHITDELMYVNMGGTAIGTCINADESYVSAIVSNPLRRYRVGSAGSQKPD